MLSDADYQAALASARQAFLAAAAQGNVSSATSPTGESVTFAGPIKALEAYRAIEAARLDQSIGSIRVVDTEIDRP